MNMLHKQMLLFSAEIIKKNIIEANERVSPGRIYNGHVASRPGDAPNIDTGALVDSTRYYLSGNSAIIGQGSSTVKYSRRLEFGDNRVQPRPNIRRVPEDDAFLKSLHSQVLQFFQREAEILMKRGLGQ